MSWSFWPFYLDVVDCEPVFLYNIHVDDKHKASLSGKVKCRALVKGVKAMERHRITVTAKTNAGEREGEGGRAKGSGLHHSVFFLICTTFIWLGINTTEYIMVCYSWVQDNKIAETCAEDLEWVRSWYWYLPVLVKFISTCIGREILAMM